MTTTYRDRFLALAREMETLAAGLNTHSTECECCHAQRFDAYEEELAARKLLGYADSFAKLAESVSGRGASAKPAPFLSRVIAPIETAVPPPSAPPVAPMSWASLDAHLTKLASNAFSPPLSPDALEAGHLAVVREVKALIDAGKVTDPASRPVLAKLNPFLRAHGITPANLRAKLSQ